MKTEIYLSKEFLKHINETVQALPGNEICVLVKDNSLKIFNKDEQGNFVLAIYKPQIQIDYAPNDSSHTGTNSNNIAGHY